MFADKVPQLVPVLWRPMLAHANRDKDHYSLFLLEAGIVLPAQVISELNRYPGTDRSVEFLMPAESPARGGHVIAYTVQLDSRVEDAARSILSYARTHHRIVTGDAPPDYAVSGITYAGEHRTADLDILCSESIEHAFERLPQARLANPPFVISLVTPTMRSQR